VNHIGVNNESDRQLVETVLLGNNAAFGTIIKNTESLVAQMVSKLVDNLEDRRDIAQEVYLKAYANLPGFRFQSKLSTWIAQIAYNTCISHLEKKKLILTGGFTASEQGVEAEDRQTKYSVEYESASLLQQKEQSAILKTEIDKLPALFKTLIVLFHNEQMSYDEISTITGLPTGTLKSYLFRARRLLKANLLARYKRDDL
jgi:RNA polymerase sigma-70 factor (ECF subfamily)